MSLRIGLLWAPVFLSTLAAGCVTEGAPPVEEVTRARAVVEQADKAGAQRYAAADLQRAHDELTSAEQANAQQKFDEARWYAQAAEVDADLATARNSAGAAQQAAHEVVKANDTLRQESGRVP
ncbi:MAG TPA: DUF4398 domain-containing protein [Steroidobacteraceae bacterium]|nr:DUF4398 domain-containing protein [Steroidobacteraceae bacterium]